MAQRDSFDDYEALTPPSAHEVDNLLDPALDAETREYFDRVKASFHLSALATGLFLYEKSFILRVREDATVPVEYLDELKVKDSVQIIATAFRTQDADGTKRIIFGKEAELSARTRHVYADLIRADRLIAGQE